MSVTWAINGTSLAALGLEFVGGTFNTGHRSVMTLRKTGDFTAAELFAWGSPVTLTRNGVKYFQGKVNSVPHSASETDESQEIEIVDAWQDLEETIYKEEWPAGSGSVMLPVAILGRKSNGAACTDAEQIQEAVAYAASVGVAIQMGSIPAGLPLWQSEVRNAAVAEVIRVSLRFHPDWVPWIDYATSPPTLHFTKRSDLSLRVIDIGDGETASVSIARRDDLKPDAVQILYLNATIIDGVTYRDWIEDRYPSDGPEGGPRVISNVIELAGGQMQFQKQRIQTRTIPTDAEECREWLKKKYPEIKDYPDSTFSVAFDGLSLIPDEPDEDLPDPVNPRAKRIEREEDDTPADFPRELVAGSIEDWMRRKVGRVHIDFAVTVGPDATEAQRKKLDPIAAMEGQTVVATNAVTQIYKGITQWSDAEAAPAGIAQAIYQSLSAYQYEGRITTVMEDVSGDRFHGCRLNIGGGRGEWAGMNAMVHSVSFEIASGTTTIAVGPAPFLAAEDMLELQRLLRARTVTWMSESERTSNELGATQDPGSKGDTVGGFNGPHSEAKYKKAPLTMYAPYIGGDSKDRLFIHPGTVRFLRVAEENPADSDPLAGLEVTPIFPTIFGTALDAADPPYFPIGGFDDCSVWLITDRLRCPTQTFVPPEDSEETHRLEIRGRDEKPDKADGELLTCIAKMDLADAPGGGKTITNLKRLVEGHVDVWYKCLNDESPGSDDGSIDWDSSNFDSDDEIDPSPSDSLECKYKIEALWANRRNCYEKGKEAYAIWRIQIGITSLRGKCPGGWKARVSMAGGLCIPYDTQICQGDEVVLPLTKLINNFGAQFRFPDPPNCEPTTLTVTIIGDPGDDSDPDECCTQFTKTFKSGWPRYCHGTCSTTLLPPP